MQRKWWYDCLHLTVFEIQEEITISSVVIRCNKHGFNAVRKCWKIIFVDSEIDWNGVRVLECCDKVV